LKDGEGNFVRKWPKEKVNSNSFYPPKTPLSQITEEFTKSVKELKPKDQVYTCEKIIMIIIAESRAESEKGNGMF
jgi:hypothetical protein